MEEKKFRVWDKKNKRMIYPNSNGFFTKASKEGFDCCIDGNGFLVDMTRMTEQEQLELLQCTGMKNWEGILFYVNDVVKDCKGDYYQIKWDEDELRYYGVCIKETWGCKDNAMTEIDGKISIYKSLEIVGNIHQETSDFSCKQ